MARTRPTRPADTRRADLLDLEAAALLVQEVKSAINNPFVYADPGEVTRAIADLRLSSLTHLSAAWTARGARLGVALLQGEGLRRMADDLSMEASAL